MTQPRNLAEHLILSTLLQRPRADVSGLAPGALALLLAEEANAPGDNSRTVIVTPSVEDAARIADDLRFFLTRNGVSAPGEQSVLFFPPLDVSPFLAVAPDRRAAMDRLATLFHLSSGLPWRFLVMPASSAIRRVMPKSSLEGRSTLIEAGEIVDRDEVLQVLIDGGYLRVPVAEDRGTFAIRGAILDVFPPHAEYPARIELFDELVESIKRFDPEDQRTVDSIDSLFLHPAKETSSVDSKKLAARVRDLCDSVNYPTLKTRALIEELESGRTFYGLDGFLPAFHEHLDTVLDYVPEARVVLLDPPAIRHGMDRELTRAIEDRDARVADSYPAFPLSALYADEDEFGKVLGARERVFVSHALSRVENAGSELSDAFSAFEAARFDGLSNEFEPGDAIENAVTRFDTQAHDTLSETLRKHRGKADADVFSPVADAVRSWLEAGFSVTVTARTHTQADRILSLLGDYDVAAFSPEKNSQAMGARVVVGSLQNGFVYGVRKEAFLSEGEIFGTRARRQRNRRRKRKAAKAFLEDLRELAVGDFVVHEEHGVGRYTGIERKTLGQSTAERMRGDEPVSFEALVVEYQGGDKLYVPVTRLGQLQKYASKDATPRIDRMGGSSFAKKKAKAKKKIRQFADDLLVLYAERAAATRPPLPAAGREFSAFEATFPFDETRDQARAIEDVLGDLEGPRPMDRLVCGDVGFGKTEVAVRAAFRMAMAGRQVALLCPTTVLSEQHFQTFKKRMRDYPVTVGQLSRFVSKEEASKVLSGAKDGTVDIIVGTHRLLSKDVHFAQLGLLIVDEEQRFGVTHKERVKSLKKNVDVLTLSATPIPRTLQMAIGGLRDLSLIATAPTDRRAVRTFACRWDDHTIKEAINRELGRGGQVFFVYNRIEGLYERAQRLQNLLPGVRIAVAHGQMAEKELATVMQEFIEGHYDVLCSTAIIESGIDIPRANTMLIDGANMFGLAQLYQIRGRVGRSRERAYCYLITPPPNQLSDDARMRIQALERFTELGSGFNVASMDMELRGVGDLLGAEQSGTVSLVGFDMFCQMLEEAIASIRGESVEQDIDPEVSVAVDAFLPDSYITDVGLRLSFYKRFSNAEDEDSIADLAQEMEDRFGRPPPAAQEFVRMTLLRPMLREYKVLGVEATRARVTMHLRQDTPLDPQKIIPLVSELSSPWKLTPDMRLTHYFDEHEEGDSIDRVRAMFKLLRPLCRQPPE